VKKNKGLSAAKKKLTAIFEVIPIWGYRVNLLDERGAVVEEYAAGDCKYDSGLFGTGQVSEKKLRQYAKRTAREMLEEAGCPRGKVIEVEPDEDI